MNSELLILISILWAVKILKGTPIFEIVWYFTMSNKIWTCLGNVGAITDGDTCVWW